MRPRTTNLSQSKPSITSTNLHGGDGIIVDVDQGLFLAAPYVSEDYNPHSALVRMQRVRGVKAHIVDMRRVRCNWNVSGDAETGNLGTGFV